MNEPTRGYFNAIEYENGTLRLAGWLATPGRLIDGFRIALRGSTVATLPIASIPAAVQVALDAVVRHLPLIVGNSVLSHLDAE